MAAFGACGMVQLCSRVEPRRRERLGGFWWDYEGNDGLPRGPQPPVFCESTAFECIYLRHQSFVSDDLWRVGKRILGSI